MCFDTNKMNPKYFLSILNFIFALGFTIKKHHLLNLLFLLPLLTFTVFHSNAANSSQADSSQNTVFDFVDRIEKDGFIEFLNDDLIEEVLFFASEHLSSQLPSKNEQVTDFESENLETFDQIIQLLEAWRIYQQQFYYSDDTNFIYFLSSHSDENQIGSLLLLLTNYLIFNFDFTEKDFSLLKNILLSISNPSQVYDSILLTDDENHLNYIILVEQIIDVFSQLKSTKPIVNYLFEARDAVEDKILSRATQKILMDISAKIQEQISLNQWLDVVDFEDKKDSLKASHFKLNFSELVQKILDGHVENLKASSAERLFQLIQHNLEEQESQLSIYSRPPSLKDKIRLGTYITFEGLASYYLAQEVMCIFSDCFSHGTSQAPLLAPIKSTLEKLISLLALGGVIQWLSEGKDLHQLEHTFLFYFNKAKFKQKQDQLICSQLLQKDRVTD